MEGIDAQEFDRLFDEGSPEAVKYMDFANPIGRPENQFISVELSAAMVALIDEVADADGVDRQTVIERWLLDKAVALDMEQT
ncbi:MAG: hypothetical protein LBG60_10700 [Bifidobacteriaceae bacterium]|nr:hypothetical protein [Bifidobacteriaceae bacterium]